MLYGSLLSILSYTEIFRGLSDMYRDAEVRVIRPGMQMLDRIQELLQYGPREAQQVSMAPFESRTFYFTPM